jgi:hypothetical protein
MPNGKNSTLAQGRKRKKERCNEEGTLGWLLAWIWKRMER